jgi:hypothetical protein
MKMSLDYVFYNAEATGTISPRDVVIFSGTANYVERTTTSASTLVAGVVPDLSSTIPPTAGGTAAGRIRVFGKTLVNVTGTVAVRDYLGTSGTLGYAQTITPAVGAVLGIALTAAAGGTCTVFVNRM